MLLPIGSKFRTIETEYYVCIVFEEDTMFKFKKLTAIALVAVAAMGLLAGCGSEKSIPTIRIH